ncbi:MAG TPA: hypothetical protein VD864_14715 [Nocardioides sp.]|nr:hypothetical protein [Nocardioides sp.]
MSTKAETTCPHGNQLYCIECRVLGAGDPKDWLGTETRFNVAVLQDDGETDYLRGPGEWCSEPANAERFTITEALAAARRWIDEDVQYRIFPAPERRRGKAPEANQTFTRVQYVVADESVMPEQYLVQTPGALTCWTPQLMDATRYPSAEDAIRARTRPEVRGGGRRPIVRRLEADNMQTFPPDDEGGYVHVVLTHRQALKLALVAEHLFKTGSHEPAASPQGDEDWAKIADEASNATLAGAKGA